MDIRDFGTALIRTGDLDPVYIGIVGAKLEEPQLCRLLLAYWFFYHLGVAAHLSNFEGNAYWAIVREAAINRTQSRSWPRGTERRHFRAEAAVKAVDWMRSHYPQPEDPVRSLKQYDFQQSLMDAVLKWLMFGPWIAFKAADMMERVYGHPVRFNKDVILMYEEPRAGLELLSKDSNFITVDRSHAAIYSGLIQFFSALWAPPDKKRMCGPQEVETILCKYKSMKGGHYHIGKDIHEVRTGLEGWGATAEKILLSMPMEVPR
jgi:Amino acid:DNA transferase